MSFDQAQSTRLGQPVPVESTYVRMFDVDPNTPDADLIEASWPGQLIWRTDTSQLMVFNEGGWHEVAGGVAGQVSYVGPTMPTGGTYSIGDTWYQTPEMKPHVWDGDSWEATSGGIKTFRQPSPPTSTAIGDIWIDSDDGEKQYRANVVGSSAISDGTSNGWVLIQDKQIPAAYNLANQAVKSSVVEYAVSASETVAPTTGWSTATPARPPGQFIWVRTTVTRNDNTTSTTNPALLTGNTGATGPQGDAGPQGVPGPTGPGGQQLYTWVKYADTPTTGMSDLPAGKDYLGLSYNQASAAESSTYADYSWSLIVGEDGTDGVPGPPGADGQPTYTWIKYGTSATGAGINDSPTGMTHMGIAYNKTTPTESTNPALYEWSLIQGPQGVQGPQGSQGVQGPAGPNGQTLYTWIKYADTPTTGMSDLPAGKEYMGIAYNKTTATESGVYADYEWSLIQGPEGDQGIPGPPGSDGQSTYTWVKYADTPTTGISDSPTNKPYLGLAYNKTSPIESNVYADYSWSLVQGPPGTTGSNGVSVTAITPYYATVTKGAAAPVQPTNQATPPAPWVTTEPAYIANTELYRTEKITYSNTTYSYTTVVKVSAYTAASNAQETADAKTRTYYADGFLPDDGDPNTPLVLAPLTVAPDGKPLTVGDLWYQSDNNNWCRFYTGVPANGVGGWVDVADPAVYSAIAQADINAGNITNLMGDVNELQGLSYSANNTADTADGRVSTSDYRPGDDDLTYTQERTVFDPLTGASTKVPYEVSRVNGSLWFMQTRIRHNMCTNPSVEANLVGWSSVNASIVRDNPANAPAGDWAITVTNSGSSAHTVSWGNPSAAVSPTPVPAPAAKGQTWSASIFVELVSGIGAGVYIELVWVDVNGTQLGVTAGDPLQLTQNVWTNEVPMQVVDWRLWAHGSAPDLTAGVFARIVSPGGNTSDVWHTGALLLEQEPDLGRYFDGTLYDGYWDGTPHNSTSGLYGEMLREIWELRQNRWTRKYLDDNTIARLDAGILEGELSGTLVTNNTIAPYKLGAVPVQAMENLAFGDLVHIYNIGGFFWARKADASVTKNYEAHGFVWETVASGQMARVYHQGYIEWPTLDPTTYVPGAYWLSTTPGKVQRTPPRTPGVLVQQVGFAASTKVLNFEPHLAIKIN
jgi:hypothetical protein